MAEGFPIIADLIIKSDPANLGQVQAQLRQTFSAGSLNLDLTKSIKADELKAQISRVHKESLGLIGTIDQLGERVTKVFGRFSAYLIASGGILSSITLLKNATSEALKFSSELVRIRQVSGDSQGNIRALGDEIGRLAKNYGVSSSELAKAAVTLKQAGFTVKQVQTTLETLAQADLAPNFDNMAKTTEGAIAIFQQFGKDADQLKARLSSLNAVAGEFAVEAADLITLFQKAGGAATSAGANFNELMGLFTAVRATTRESADSIATGLRTIFGRLQRPDTIKFLDELGIKMRYTAEEAKAAGKNVGDFVGPFEAIMRISQATAGVGQGSPLFANIVEQIGGLRQLSRVIPLIKEANLARDAYFVGLAGENSLYVNSLQKQDDYLNRLEKIKQKFLEVGRTFIQSEGFEKFASNLGVIAEAAIKAVNAIAPLIPILTTLSTLALSFGLIKSLGQSLGSSVGILPYQGTQRRFASGGIVPGSGNTDNYPAVLMPGEAVIPKKQVSKFPSLIQGLIKGDIKGYAGGYMPPISGGSDEQQKILKKVLEEILKKTGIKTNVSDISITDLFGKTNAPKDSETPSGGYTYSNKQIKINPREFGDLGELKRVLSHELGHNIFHQLGDKLDPTVKQIALEKDTRYQSALKSGDSEIIKYLSEDRELFARIMEYELKRGQNPKEILKAMGYSDKEINKVTGKRTWSQFAGSIGGKLISEKPQQARKPGRFDWIGEKGTNFINRIFGPAYNATVGKVYGGIDIPESTTVSKPPLLSSKLSVNNLRSNQSEIASDPTIGGLLKTASGSATKASKYFDSLAITSLDEGHSNKQLQSILKAKEQEKALKAEIDRLESGRREGREYYPKHFKGNTSKYDFSQVGSDAQNYLRDKGGYLENLRNKQKELSDIRTTLNEPSPYSRHGNLFLPKDIPGLDMNSVKASQNRGWSGTTESSYLKQSPYGGITNPNPSNVMYGPPNRPMGPFGFLFGGDDDGPRGPRGPKGPSGPNPPNNPPNMPPGNFDDNVVNKLLGAKKWGNIAANVAAVGIPLGLGGISAYSDNQETQTRFGAAAAGAGIGAGLGSAAGPLGALAGSLLGGILGWITSGAQAAKEVEAKLSKTALDKSIGELGQALDDLREGRGSPTDLANRLKDVRAKASAEASRRAKGGEDFAKANNEELQKAAGIRQAELQKVVTEEIRKQAKSGQSLDIQSGPFKEITSTLIALRQRPGQSFGLSDLQKESQLTYKAARETEIRIEASKKFELELNKSIASASAFAEAIEQAAKSTTELDKNFKVILEGGYSGASFNVGEYGSINRGTLNRLSGVSGGAFGELTEKVGGAETVARYLPDALSRIIKPGDPSNTEVTSIGNDLANVFEQIGKTAGIKFDQKVINVIAHQLEGIKGEDLFEDFRKAPEQFAENLLKSFQPARQALESIGKNLEQRDQVYAQGLQTLIQLNDRINQLKQSQVSNKTRLLDIDDLRTQNRTGIPFSFPSLNNARRPFLEEQDRLIGTPGIGDNAGAIAARIQEEKRVRAELSKRATEEANAGGKSTEFRDKLAESEKRLANFNRALENLTTRTEELSRLQAQLAALERSKEADFSLKSNIVSSNPDQLRSMNQDFMATGLVSRFGIRGIQQQARRMMGPQGDYYSADMINRAKNVLTGPLGERMTFDRTIDGQRVKLTGNQEWRRIMGENPLKPKEDEITKNIDRVLQEIKAIQTTSGEATDFLVDDLMATQKDLLTSLKSSNEAFFRKTDELITTLKDNALQTEEATTRTELNATDKFAGVASKWDLNRVDQRDLFETAKKRAGDIEAFLGAKSNYEAAKDTSKANANQVISQLPKEFSFGSNDKDLPNIIRSMQGAGISPEAQKVVTGTIKSRQSQITELETQLKKGKISVDGTGSPMLGMDGVTIRTPLSNEEKDAAQKKLAQLKAANTPEGLRQNIINAQMGGYGNALDKARNKLRDRRLENLTPEDIAFIKSGENPDKINAQRTKLQEKLIKVQTERAKNQNVDINNMRQNSKLDEALNQQRNTQGPQNVPNQTLQQRFKFSPEQKFAPSMPDSSGTPQKLDKPFDKNNPNKLGPNLNLLSSENKVNNNPLFNNATLSLTKVFEGAGNILGNFATNFAKQVEGLAQIPRNIDMNVNQKVEVIINGAEILTKLEPGMQMVANKAVSKALEAVGGQLQGYGITINYNPNEA